MTETNRLMKHLDEYNKDKKLEKRVIYYACNIWSKGKWHLEQSNIELDIKGIDAYGYEINKTKDNTNLLVQIKTVSFLSLGKLQKRAYIRRISNNMTKHDPTASQRLLVFEKTGKKIRLWNYSIEKILDGNVNGF